MPQKSQDNMKATTPSKLMQQNIDKDWGAQQKATTDPKKALADKHTNHPIKP